MSIKNKDLFIYLLSSKRCIIRLCAKHQVKMNLFSNFVYILDICSKQLTLMALILCFIQRKKAELGSGVALVTMAASRWGGWLEGFGNALEAVWKTVMSNRLQHYCGLHSCKGQNKKQIKMFTCCSWRSAKEPVETCPFSKFHAFLIPLSQSAKISFSVIHNLFSTSN